MNDIISIFTDEAGLSIFDLRSIISNAPDRYKVYEIDKKSGGKREIAQPAREVKLLQYILMDKILSKLPVHPAAKAYRPATSILDNASPHKGKTPILKMDFKDFFPSIVANDWKLYCDKNNLLTENDRRITSLILFRRRRNEQTLRLSIGAPSSPMLSNILMFQFDELMSLAAAKRSITYTRYADDLTFSGQRIGMLRDMIKEVKAALRLLDSPRLHINENKTAFVTSAVRRQVTGVVLANDGSAGLGRDRKRLISARVHKASQHVLAAGDVRSLAGELAFVKVIEPEFIEWLEQKYGEDLIARIKRLQV